MEFTAPPRLTPTVVDELPASHEGELQEALDAALLQQEALLRAMADRLEEIEHLNEVLRTQQLSMEVEQQAQASRDVEDEILSSTQDIAQLEAQIARERVRVERERLERERQARIAEQERVRQERLAELREKERQRQEQLTREELIHRHEAEQSALRDQLAQLTDEIAAKDNLIDSHQTVMNDYRCRFGLHTSRVPGGCPNPRPAETFTIPIHHCMVDQSAALPAGELQRMVDGANESLTPFFARESGGLAHIEFTAGSQHVVTVPAGFVTLSSFASPSSSGDCVNAVLNAHGGWDNYPDEPDPQLWTIHRLVVVRSTTILDSLAGAAAMDSGPAFVVYRDEASDQGDPFPLAVAAHEIAHMLWGMAHVNESSCDHTSSLIDVGAGPSACPGLTPQSQLTSLTIDCRNRQRAGWLC